MKVLKDLLSDLAFLRSLTEGQEELGNIGVLRTDGKNEELIFGASLNVSSDLLQEIRDRKKRVRVVARTGLRSLKFVSKSERQKIDLNASRQICSYLVSLDSQDESAEMIGKRFISLAGRDSDSEYLLLSYASHMISNRYWSDSVVLRIMSERPPCKSCSSAITQFLARHAEAKLELYFIELPGDWNNLPACGRLKVTWVVNLFSLTGSMVWV